MAAPRALMRGCQGASFGGVISGSCVESTRDSRVLIKGSGGI